MLHDCSQPLGCSGELSGILGMDVHDVEGEKTNGVEIGAGGMRHPSEMTKLCWMASHYRTNLAIPRKLQGISRIF